jgi:hypothetical protein
MGGKLVTRGSAVGVWFPGARVNLNLGEEPPGKGGSVGSVINHVGFIVNNVQEQTAKWKAAGVPVLAGNNNRLDQAFVVTPDGVRVEILEDKTQTIPIQHEHVHFFLPEAEIPKAVAWYAKIFGGKVGLSPCAGSSCGRAPTKRAVRHLQSRCLPPLAWIPRGLGSPQSEVGGLSCSVVGWRFHHHD